jgi:hypothetical protein
MSRKRQLCGRSEYLEFARRRVVHEHGLRKIEIGGDRVSLIAGERTALKKDTERVAAVAVSTDENFEYMELPERGQNMFLSESPVSDIGKAESYPGMPSMKANKEVP